MRDRTTPLSALLFLSLPLRPLFIKPLLQPCLNLAAKIMQKKYPNVVQCLSEFESANLLIDPLDLPFSIMLSMQSDKLLLTQVTKNQPIQYDAKITAAFWKLTQLMEGKIDGDALFFSRGLAIEGNMEIVLALRNRLDAEQIDLRKDLLSIWGPLAKPLGLIGNQLEKWLHRMDDDLTTMQSAIVGPTKNCCDRQERNIKKLSEQMATLEKQLDTSKAAINSLKRKLSKERSLNAQKTT